jgi:hypothetical protein
VPALTAPVVVPPPPAPAPPAAPELPAPPDASGVNASWQAHASQGAGPLGALRARLARLLRPWLEAQRHFNALQVRLDNELLGYLARHFAATHGHYDRLIAADSVRMNEIDERHLQLQERLVAHVHELVRRVDFVLETAERSRLSGEADLRRIAPRLEALERRLDELEKRLGRG